jgi:uncharacterized surface protein with fasciclin (FAS1) repeats
MKMTLTTNVFVKIAYVILSILCVFSLSTCKQYEDPTGLQITAEDNITTFLEKNNSQFSLFLEMLNRDITLSNGSIIKYSSFLNGYAGDYNGYTLFAPTNEAISNYLIKHSYSSVSDISNAEIEKLLSFHILTDTITTTSFKDGKLGTPTMYGQYLIVKSVFVNNSAKILVNKQAYIITKNVSLGNGIVHIIDGVLEPSESTVYQKILNDPSYSIFAAALQATKYADTLNVDAKISNRWYTVFPVSDSVYSKLGITSFDQLKNKYSNNGNSPENADDSLNLYVRYHIVNSLNFVADFMDGATYATKAGSSNPIAITIRSGNVIVNEYIVNGDTTKGAYINRDYSDNSCNNGVIHVANENYEIIIWHQSRVFFDFTDFSDIRSKVSYWGQSYATSLTLYDDELSGIDIYSKAGSTNEKIVYTGFEKQTSKRIYVNYNCVTLKLRATKAIDWIKFNTPFVAAGTYKVWFAYATDGNTYDTDPVSVTIGTSANDSTEMGNIVYFTKALSARGTRTLYEWDNYLYGLGMKRPSQLAGAVKYTETSNVAQYLGKITFSSSGSHWLKLTSLTPNSGKDMNVDYVEFIPVDDDQIWPKPGQDGTWYVRPADNYDDTNSAIY